MPHARLIKRYTDLVTPDGRAAIIYSGSFEYGPFRLPFASFLLRDAGNGTTQRRSLRSACLITQSASGWQLSHNQLKTKFEVHPRAPVFATDLFSSPAGHIRWTCDAPAADISGECDGLAFIGRGYSEQLELSLAPWHVPIDTLLWGRFVSDDPAAADSHLVWIQWLGQHPLILVLTSNGRESAANITSSLISGQDWQLATTESGVLREGFLNAGPLARVPALTAALPASVQRLLESHERKALSRATLTRHNRQTSGWVISEVVRFGAHEKS